MLEQFGSPDDGIRFMIKDNRYVLITLLIDGFHTYAASPEKI